MMCVKAILGNEGLHSVYESLHSGTVSWRGIVAFIDLGLFIEVIKLDGRRCHDASREGRIIISFFVEAHRLWTVVKSVLIGRICVC